MTKEKTHLKTLSPENQAEGESCCGGEKKAKAEGESCCGGEKKAKAEGESCCGGEKPSVGRVVEQFAGEMMEQLRTRGPELIAVFGKALQDLGAELGTHTQPEKKAGGCCGGAKAAKPSPVEGDVGNGLRDAVRDHYAAVARGEVAACGTATPAEAARALGYSAEDLAAAGDANLGLGCGNPLALASIEPGMTVVDLGSGAGFDAFLAAEKVGPSGKVIGVDMTDDMLELARQNALKRGASQVEFRKGHIEQLPVEDGTVDLVISNCVINLSTDKPQVFREIARVLKPGGRLAVSDMVLLKQLPDQVAKDVSAYVGCISGASLLNDYLSMAMEAGLGELSIPQVVSGATLAEVLAPDAVKGLSCCGSSSATSEGGLDATVAQLAAQSVASIKLFARKP